MAGEILKAGIRFNKEDLKYVSISFDSDLDSPSCTIDAEFIIEGSPVILRGTASEWAQVEDEESGSDPLLSVNPVRSTKTTAKKAVKESK